MTSGEDYRGRTPKRANMLAILLPLTPASLTVVTERLTPSVATLQIKPSRPVMARRRNVRKKGISAPLFQISIMPRAAL